MRCNKKPHEATTKWRDLTLIIILVACIVSVSPFLRAMPASAESWLAGWSYRISHEIEGSTGGAQTDYPVKVTVHYEGLNIRGEGTPLSRNDALDYNPSTNTVTKKHDFLNDPSHYTEIFQPPAEGEDYWIGAASILKDGSTYYLVLRERNGDIERGHEVRCYSSTNLADWNIIWTVAIEDVGGGITVYSFEKMSLRKYGGYYYLYVCYDYVGSPHAWKTVCVKSTTIAGLETQLEDGANHIDLGIPTNGKDPEVCEIDGEYYMINRGGADSNNRLYKCSTPDGTFSEVCDLNALYTAKWNMSDSHSTGTILYDESSDYFIMWQKSKHGIMHYWWYAVSIDLENWIVTNRELITESYSGRFIYTTYHALDDQRIILIMEGDHDDDGDRSLLLWDYSDDPEGSTATNPIDRTIGIDEHVFLNEKCKTDFGDIRFATDDGTTLLDYWMQTKVDGDYAVFWVETSSIPASPNEATIYVYYGKSDASSLSNGPNTFLRFDDFVNAAKWTADSGNPDEIIIQNGQIEARCYGDTANEIYYTPDSSTILSYRLGFKFKPLVWNNETHIRIGISNETGVLNPDEGWSVSTKDKNEGLTLTHHHLAVKTDADLVANFTEGEWYNVLMLIDGGDGLLQTELGEVSQSLTSPTDTKYLRVWDRSSGYYNLESADFDDMFLAKYVDPEPTHGSWGAEETEPTQQQNVTAVADSFVSSMYPNDNFGSYTYLWITYPIYPVNSMDRAYLKFNLPSDWTAEDVDNATLALTIHTMGLGEPTIHVHYVSDDSWTELGIVYNNAPSYGSSLYSVKLPAYYDANTTYYWNLTDTVKTEIAGDKVLSICVETPTDNSSSVWHSRSGPLQYVPLLMLNGPEGPSGPPSKAWIEVHAFVGEDEVTADGLIVETEQQFTTPDTVEVDPDRSMGKIDRSIDLTESSYP